MVCKCLWLWLHTGSDLKPSCQFFFIYLFLKNFTVREWKRNLFVLFSCWFILFDSTKNHIKTNDVKMNVSINYDWNGFRFWLLFSGSLCVICLQTHRSKTCTVTCCATKPSLWAWDWTLYLPCKRTGNLSWLHSCNLMVNRQCWDTRPQVGNKHWFIVNTHCSQKVLRSF